MPTAKELDNYKMLNFWKTFSCQFEIGARLKARLLRCYVILLSLLNHRSLFFILTLGGGMEHGDVCEMVSCT